MPGTGNLPREKKYDFVFCGMGCAGLSLLIRMIRSGRFTGKKILLLDRDAKNKNDRTWCFWEKGEGYFEPIVYKQWPVVSFYGDQFRKDSDISPYRYKMIRGIDFYQYCFEEINRQENIEIVYAAIDKWYRDGEETYFVLNGQTCPVGSPEVFNSVYEPAEGKKILRLLQHFKGWLIETDAPVFDPGRATMMDFRVSQERGTTFAYVLPFTPTTALVEYTLFTRNILPQEEYDRGLRDYLKSFLQIDQYRVREEEFGVIPMTNERLRFRGHGWQIGTAGGQTKASSGYTFRFIQKQSDRILERLLAGRSLDGLTGTPKRFLFYDHTLLRILYHQTLPGGEIFTRLFRKNDTRQVLRFLDNESTPAEELKIISTLPAWPFFKAAIGGLRWV